MLHASRVWQNWRSAGSQRWRDLPISRKLALGFGLLLLLTSAAAGATLFGLANVQQLYRKVVDQDIHNQFLISEFERNLLSAQRGQADYLLNWQSLGPQAAFDRYVLPFLASTGRIRQILTELRAGADSSTAADLDQLQTNLASYEHSFVRIADLYSTRGFHQTGLEGEFSAAGDSMQAQITGRPALEPLLLTLLGLRQYEKDYLLRGDLQDAQADRAALADWRVQVATADLSAVEQGQLLALTDVYQAAFERLVSALTEVDQELQLANEVNQTIQPGVEKIALAEQNATQTDIARAQALGRQLTLLAVSAQAAAILFSLGLAYTVTRGLSGPLRRLSAATDRFGSGDLAARVKVEGRDEIGALSTAFNGMADSLSASLDRLAESAKALTVSAEVSRRLTTILDQSELLVAVVDQIQAAFGYYHAHIYLFDPARENLVMAGGTGEAGRTMLARGHHIPRGRGLVGRAAETRQPVVAANTRQDPNWLPNPLLPETRSEIAVPIQLGDTVLGVLDVQQNTAGGLGAQDAELLRTVAAQVAVALQNARLYTQARSQAEREAVINRIGQRLQAAASPDEALQIAARELGQALRVRRVSAHLEVERGGEAE